MIIPDGFLAAIYPVPVPVLIYFLSGKGISHNSRLPQKVASLYH
jgi:hypothetical protein